MRIGISAYLLHGGQDYRGAGVSMYIYHLLRHLPPQHRYVAYHGADVPEAIPGVEGRVSPVPTWKPLVRIPWEQTVLPAQARRGGLDVLHGTVNVIPLFCPVPTVVTVHDLAFMRLPERFTPAKAKYLQHAVRLSVRRATRVIAVSQNTRTDVIDLFGVAPERVEVVYSGVDPAFRPIESGRIRQRIGRPYILHVGTLEPRKNIDVLIRAYAALHPRPPHALVLVGARGWMYDSLFKLVRDLRLHDDVHFVDYVPWHELPLWYNDADLFAYPSAYEGFGLPLLEAMACGCPVVTTAGGATQEIAEGAALMVEAGAVDALREAMMRIIDDNSLVRSLSQAGLARAAAFSWEDTGRRTAEVYVQAGSERC